MMLRNYFRKGFLPFYCNEGGGEGGSEGNAGGGGGDTGFVGSDGTFNDGWTGRDEFKDHADTLGRYKNVTDLAKGHVELRKKFSKNPDVMFEKPSETSSDDVRAAWAKAHDVPETDDGYVYDYSDDFATKLGPLSDEKMVAAKEFARKKNWSNQDLQDVLDFYHTNLLADSESGIAQMEELTNQRVESGNAILKNMWLDGMEDRTKAADEHLEKYANFDVKGENGEDVNVLQMLFDESPNLETSPWLTLAMDNMASKMGEANRVGGKGGNTLSLEGINSQIADLRAQQSKIRKENPVNFKGDPQFKDIERKLVALYQKKSA
jgi:hypothetical protein